MPDPQCIKTYYQTTMMPKVPKRMGFYYGQTPKSLHYARTARALRLRRPHSIVVRTEQRVQRTLMFGPYFLRT